MEALSPLEKMLVDRFLYICTALFIITVDKITEFSEDIRSDYYNTKLRDKFSNGYPINELM